MEQKVPDKDNKELKTTLLLEEYRQAMESQRSNTTVVYSWLGSIFLVISTGLFFFGITVDKLTTFVPAMALAIVLSLVWLGLTETFIFYMRQRFKRIHEIEHELGLKLMTEAASEIRQLGWRARLVETRTYVRLFILLYIAIWILALILKF
jgi:hypothetical protein